MKSIVVGVGEYQVAKGPKGLLATYALGSCIGVAIYDPALRLGGLLHFMLPDSAMDTHRAQTNPALFADTGISAMVKALKDASAEPSRMRVQIAGGAQVVAGAAGMNIGKRNYLAARKMFWKLGLMVESEAIGGTVPRHLSLRLIDGDVRVELAEMQRVAEA